MRTFDLLTGSRSIGISGVGPIPLSEIIVYANNFEIVEDDPLIFCQVIKAIDSLYLDDYYKKVKTDKNKNNNNRAGSHKRSKTPARGSIRR